MEVKNTRLLFLYRSWLFKKCIFTTNIEELKIIVKTLNIKNRRQRIEYIYDEAVKYVEQYYSDDLCQFENGQCIAQRNGGCNHINGCCRKCSLVTDKGCSTCNFACKLIYCKSALGNIKLLKIRDIPILKCLSISQRIILKASFFNTKEEVLKQLYYGIVYSTFITLKKELFKI